MKTVLASLILMLALVGCHQSSTVTPSGKEVKVNTGPPFIINRGETKPLQVDIFRAGFDAPVSVTLSDLPAGVTASEYKKTADGPSATFNVTASPSAIPVANKNAKVHVTGPDGVSFTHPFSVSVK